ncbi:MAG: Septum formation [Marmoricola sp.]|nr:Septum formation [Marmoricola sp.]
MVRRTPSTGLLAALLACFVTVALTACASAPLAPASSGERRGGATPRLGACYVLAPEDTASPTSTSPPVPCTQPHTSETFAIGTLPASTGDGYRDQAHGRWVYTTCEKAFEKFLALDESRALRVTLSWAWFRPSEADWKDGRRWYRCDVVGGTAEATSYQRLPRTARGLFRAKPPEQWSLCAQGPSVLASKKLPCTRPHDWRAVTTVKLGAPKAAYPGDRLVQVQSRDFCSDSVGAWMNYPVDYEFGYTWFHEAEWKAGNRRAICWAKTDR